MAIYVIWKEQRGSVIDGHSEVVGLFEGTYAEADALIEKLNAADDSVIPGCSWHGPRYGYWRSEPPAITAKNWGEFVPH